jgi:S-adenosylhomocysteine hydrolase
MASFERLVRARRVGAPLRGFSVIGVQHILGSTGGLLRALEQSGAASIDMEDKSYSANWVVATSLRRDGVGVPARGPAGRRRTAEGDPLERLVSALERDPDPARRVLVIDDGGELIKRIDDLLGRRPDLMGRIVAVEQTTRGIRELEKRALRLPVISVGGARAKTRYESPMIGRSVGQAIERKLMSLRTQGVHVRREIVLSGYGNVGRATARFLQGLGHRVVAYDRAVEADPTSARAVEIARNARRDGVRLMSRADALARAHVLVEGSGDPDLTDADLDEVPDGAVLVNAGSGIVRFGATRRMLSDPARRAWRGAVWSRFRGRTIELGKSWSDRQDAVVRTRSGKQLLLADGGMVINFAPRWGSPTPHAAAGIDPIPPRYIQLTRGLLYLAALQAVETTDPGLHDLDVSVQKTWVEAVQGELAGSGESLLHPTF